MRACPLVTATAIAVVSWVGAGCSPRPTPSPTPSPTPHDLTIGIHLFRQAEPPKKCLVSFDNADFKLAQHAVAYTGFNVTWQVTKNDCGDLKKLKKKALGLKYLKVKGGQTAKWIKNCTDLSDVPGQFSSPPAFLCQIPVADEGDIEGLYEYEIDGDSVEPKDPDLDVKRGG
jgi:hypothetical protein